jgi:outer membrane protein TolC
VKTTHNPLYRRARLIAFACLPAACFAAGPGIASAQVSLRTVVELAQRNSSAVRIAQADVAKAQAQVSETKDVLVPTLSVSTGIPAFPEVGFTGQPPSLWSATVQSLIYSIPQKHYIDAAGAGLHAAIARLKDSQEQVALDASNAYIEMDTVDQELAAVRQQQADADRLTQIEQQRAEAGVDPMTELLQAKLTAANLRLSQIHLETRLANAAKQLSILTGLPLGSITPDHASIPEIPPVTGNVRQQAVHGIEAARFIADSKFQIAKGDQESNNYPQLSFFAQYNRNTTILNDVNSFFAHSLPANNFASGIAIQLPIFDLGHRAKGRESAADALRAKVEAEQAEHQNDLQIEELNGSLRELDAQAEVASLKQQIAAAQLRAVQTELQNGNGATAVPGGPAQASPKAAQLAEIDERQKYLDSLDAGFDLAKARLGLLRALGHMQDWLNEVHAK